MNDIHIIGILDNGWASLAEAAKNVLASADLVIGATRMLEQVRPHLASHCETRPMDAALGQVSGWLATARAAGRRSVVLATGDPLCHGIAPLLIKHLGHERLTLLPAPSTLQLAAARLGKPWADAVIASCHGKDAGEWHVGATPDHGLYPLMRAITLHQRVLAFMSPANDPARLARAVLSAGLDEGLKLSVAACLNTADEILYPDLTPARAALTEFAQPCVALIERTPGMNENTARFGLEDSEYQQRTPEKGLITKQEARALSLAKLNLRASAVVWDIGAGSGSVGLEAARLVPQSHVWAIEKNPADAAIARANAAHLHATNYTLHTGRAPDGLDAWPDPDAVFIGGSAGELAELIRLACQRLNPAGRLVMNFVTLENLATATATLKELGIHWEVVQLQASRSQPILDLHRLAAQNPVWIITAYKEAHPS
jgi:precorrin-6Y C5,15-methyltransferase (decarboxylating)